MQKSIRFTSENTLAQQCYEQIQEEIIEGILKPGQKLKVGPLKERFGIGQSPVREALSRLAAFGLVEVIDNKGFRVSAISQEDIRDTYKTFTAIENMALALAMQQGNEGWEATIVAELHKLGLIEKKGTCPSYAQWAEQNYAFHKALIEGCNSPALLEIRRYIYMKFDRYCRMAYQLTSHTLELNYQEHKKLADAVLKRDIKQAQALMQYHINAPLEEIIKKLKENTLI